MSTFKGSPPGLPFHRMLDLTVRNHRRGSKRPLGPFTEQLMLAIFWEETLFTNRRQFQGGRGVGFGQVEKQELTKLKTQKAKEHGFFVPGVNSSTVQLDDDRAVQIASCTLLQLWYHEDNVRHSRDFALHGYGGVKQASGTSVSKQDRLNTIQGWKNCELHLQQLNVFTLERIFNSTLDIKELEDQILAALKKSRTFVEDLTFRQPDGSQPTFRQLVFPPLWFVPTELIQLFLPFGTFLKFGSAGGQVKLLQHALNSQAAATPRLAADGLFGSKTQGAVVGFQTHHLLAADGIVGPKTKAKLLPAKAA